MTIKIFQIGLVAYLTLNSLIAYGGNAPFETLTVKNETVQINYEFMDKASFQKEREITELITESFKIYQNIFSGSPRDLKGTEYTNFTVKVNRGRHLGGEADPKIIFLTWSDEKVFGYSNWKTLLLHEVFHLWSAETIRYKNGREHWFNEGFAEYYAFRTAAKLGLISPEEALSIAAHPIGYYFTAQGLGNISMREAGKDNKTKFDNYFLIYNGGWVIAMILDYDIRSRTDGEKSLDDLMKWLYVNFQRHEKLYNIKDIIRGIKRGTGIDYNDFFNDYIAGVKPAPVANYFDLGKAVWDLKFDKSSYSKHKYLFQTLGIVESK